MCQFCTPPADRWTGRYSKSSLAAACAELGVTKPVRIAAGELANKGDMGRGGDYIPAPDFSEHRIRVNTRLTPEVANETLLHELVHAAQHERDGVATAQAKYSLLTLLGGYENNPLEVEARERAAELKDRHRITR